MTFPELSYLFPPELELLVLATRLDESCSDRWDQLLGSDLDWSLLLKYAYFHQLLPLFYARLKSNPSPNIPPAKLEYLKRIYILNAQRNLRHVRLLLRVLDAFADNGIRSVPFKGPALAHSLYGDVSLRHFADLDILIHPDDLSIATEILLASGFTTELALDHQQRAWLLRMDSEIMFSYQDDLLELHLALFESYVRYPLREDIFWLNLETLEFFGRQVNFFSPEHLTLFLCIHAAKHHWSRFSRISDLARCIYSFPDLDWESVFIQAQRFGFLHIMILGVRLAELVYGAEIPAEVQRYENSYPQLQTLLQRTVSGLNTVTPHTDLENLRYYFNLRERWRDRVYIIYDLLLVPKYIDWETLPLPGFLYPLYYIFRPVRLLLKFAPRLLPTQLNLFH